MAPGASIPEVTILGAGIVGVCCALSALERGLGVTLVDRLEPGEATSYGNAGVISSWSCVFQCMPGTRRNVPGWLLDPDGPVKLNWRDLHRVLLLVRVGADQGPLRDRRGLGQWR